MRIWRCGGIDLILDRPLVMGIVNVTPDSFFDGGSTACVDSALAHAQHLLDAGADIIDVGGESTRPGAASISPADEIARVLPVVSVLAAEGTFPVSIDTRHASVAAACIEAGAHIINDVSGFSDSAMASVASASGAGIVIVHMLGEPATMQVAPFYEDVVAEVLEFLSARALALVAEGVDPESICVDPGIGFGKTVEHNLKLMRSLDRFAEMSYPVMLGASRKRFIADIAGSQAEVPKDRLGGSIAAAVWGALNGVAVLRVHDVAETVQAVRVAQALAEG
ncbi:MAG: dihydropteroate synthase [Actinobacteria bacterium]|nr:dihydropteroate synthase [Actinomycetota bacterium]